MDRKLCRIAGAAAMVLLCAATAACARPVGDLGRARPGVLHDEIMPAIGEARAGLAGEPVSAFNLTDQEREMHDRVWRFLVAPHAEDWFMDTVVELRRTRLAGGRRGFHPDRYYRWLHETDYRSSRVRFATVADDAQHDIDTAPATFASICAVLEIDRRRGVASRELEGLSYGDVAARHAENEMFIDWFVQSLRYRYDAYNYALDRLLVETPHEEAIEVDARLSALAIYVERAERGDFCHADGPGIGGGDAAIRPRVLMHVPGEGVYRK